MGNMSNVRIAYSDTTPFTGGGGPDTESKRSVIKDQRILKGKVGQEGQRGKKGNAKGKGSQETDEAPPVTDLHNIKSLDHKLCVLGGTNLRKLRDGLRLFPTGII